MEKSERIVTAVYYMAEKSLLQAYEELYSAGRNGEDLSPFNANLEHAQGMLRCADTARDLLHDELYNESYGEGAGFKRWMDEFAEEQIFIFDHGGRSENTGAGEALKILRQFFDHDAQNEKITKQDFFDLFVEEEPFSETDDFIAFADTAYDHAKESLGEIDLSKEEYLACIRGALKRDFVQLVTANAMLAPYDASDAQAFYGCCAIAQEFSNSLILNDDAHELRVKLEELCDNFYMVAPKEALLLSTWENIYYQNKEKSFPVYTNSETGKSQVYVDGEPFENDLSTLAETYGIEELSFGSMYALAGENTRLAGAIDGIGYDDPKEVLAGIAPKVLENLNGDIETADKILGKTIYGRLYDGITGEILSSAALWTAQGQLTTQGGAPSMFDNSQTVAKNQDVQAR